MAEPAEAIEALLAAGAIDAARAQLDALPPASAAFPALHRRLAEARAAAGDPAAAFAHYASANALERRPLNYAVGRDERYCQRIAATLDEAVTARLAGGGADSARPIFVVGMPRAGTAAVERILAAHPRVQAGGALDVAAQVAGAIRQKDDDSVGFPEILPRVGPADLQLYGQAYLARLPEAAAGTDRLTDAAPGNFRFLGLIHAMLPRAAIVHVRADPLATCWACYRGALGPAHPYSYDLVELGRYYRSYARLMEHWRAVLPAGTLVEVALGELQAAPERALARLLDGCGLGWAEACRSAAAAEAEAPSAAAAWQPFTAFLAPLRAALADLDPLAAPAQAAGATTLAEAVQAAPHPDLTAGQRLLAAQQPEAARAAFDRRLAADASSWVAHWGRAASLQAQGDRAGALASYLAAQRRNPDNPGLCGYIAWLAPQRADSTVQAVLAATLADLDPASPGTQSVAFALGGVCHAQHAVDRAFAYYQVGNDLARLQVADTAPGLRAWPALQAALPQTKCDALHGAGPADPSPIFIVGMPRSGTTLVEQILASHPQVVPGREREDLAQVVDTTEIAAAGAAGVPAYADRLAPADAARMGRAYLDRLPALGPGETRITDKMPANFQLAGLIPALLPGAKIVHVTRQPGDTALSIFRQRFTAGAAYRSDLAAIGRFYAGYLDLMDHWRGCVPAGWLLELAYEDLVADPEGEVERLLAYCGLPWDDACLAFHERAPDARTASRWQVGQPIYTGSVGQWRRYWAHLGPFFAELGDWAPEEVRGD